VRKQRRSLLLIIILLLLFSDRIPIPITITISISISKTHITVACCVVYGALCAEFGVGSVGSWNTHTPHWLRSPHYALQRAKQTRKQLASDTLCVKMKNTVIVHTIFKLHLILFVAVAVPVCQNIGLTRMNTLNDIV